MAPSRPPAGGDAPACDSSAGATEFYPHMPSQTNDKIRLLIQKLEEGFVPRDAVSENFVVYCA